MPQKIIEHIVAWLRGQLHDSHAEGYVLGVSGGLDSAVCVPLIKKASDNCLGLIIPIESNIADCDDAAMVASTFGLRIEYIDLTNTYRSLLKMLPGNDRVAQGNVKARLRMVTIYYYANIRNYLVCGSSNRTEVTLGYFTKFGDGASDVLPLGDLYKHQVRAIAQELGVPQKIVDKVPTAGLWKGQTDEGEIGFSYEELEKTLKDIKMGQAFGDCAEKVRTMIERSKHKRQPPEICRLQKNDEHNG